MEWKCNTYDCQHTFKDSTTREQVDADNFKSPDCPKCKDEHNGCYVVGEKVTE